jgi:hypothetical protein
LRKGTPFLLKEREGEECKGRPVQGGHSPGLQAAAL